MKTPDSGTTMGRLCAFCGYRDCTSYFCGAGFLQAIDKPCLPSAPWAIVKGKIISYSDFNIINSKENKDETIKKHSKGKDGISLEN